MSRLIHILLDNELFGALEYDLRAYCHGADIRELFEDEPTVTFRQLTSWIRHLPEESALHRRGVAGDLKPKFDNRLAAAAVNEIRLSNYMFDMANTDEKQAKRIQKPDLIDLDEIYEE